MKNIHDDLLSAAKEYGKTKDVVDYMTGANVAGFLKVANALVAYGIL